MAVCFINIVVNISVISLDFIGFRQKKYHKLGPVDSKELQSGLQFPKLIKMYWKGKFFGLLTYLQMQFSIMTQ